jgi:OOP family OmpA-OmpF porin
MAGSMKRVSVSMLTAVAMIASFASGAAQAQTDPPAVNRGFYVGGAAGANFQETNRFRGGAADSNAGYDTGYVGLLSLGYGMGSGLRLELEGSYRNNGVGRISGATGHGGSQIGSLMVNGIYDLNYALPGFLQALEPHFGAGIGAAKVWEHSAPHAGFLVHGQDTVPAVQAIAGVDYALTPALKLGLDYRYFLAHDANFRNATTGARVKGGDYNDHALLLTFRYEFGAPRAQPAAAPAPVAAPPAPPAPPPPPVARNFTVYFDLDRATLTPAGRDVVRQAAANAKSGQVSRVTVIGHADTTGSARHNQRLSERRAAAVRDELVADGVPADQIVTEGRGENDLAIPTADQVNEPRNRRVVIVEQGPGM